jgi:hypothetical protein
MPACGRGRPRKLTAAITERLCHALSIGTTHADACRYAGLSYRTYRRHLARGEAEAERLEAHPRSRPKKSERDFLHFCQAIKRAEAVGVLRMLARINEAASHHWQAAAWLLERLYPQDYGRRVHYIRHSGQVTAQTEVHRFPPKARPPQAWEAYARPRGLLDRRPTEEPSA